MLYEALNNIRTTYGAEVSRIRQGTVPLYVTLFLDSAETSLCLLFVAI